MMLPYTAGTPYQIRLSVFEGPLDLLLQLIEREKLDISTVSLAQVTDQFLAYVRELEIVRPDTLADFLVMAARLVLIKSRLLLPQPPKLSADEDGDDPGEALARQLREYKRFKEAAQFLRALEEAGRHTYPRTAFPPLLERRLAGGEATLADLLKAAQAVFASLPPEPPVPPGIVVPFTLTIGDQIALIRQATAGERPVTFSSLLRSARHRLEIIVTLLAVLELIKRGQIRALQPDMFGEITLVPVAGVEITVEEDGNGQASSA
jgi:segregation and condensation protein A